MPHDPAEDETTRLRRVYGAYAADETTRQRWDPDQPGNRRILDERSALLRSVLGPGPGTVVDLGCGDGAVLSSVLSTTPAGGSGSRGIGIDLLESRLRVAQAHHPDLPVVVADGTALPLAGDTVDLMLVFTVFSSIRDGSVAAGVAAEIRRVVRPGGQVIWYDLRRPNPRNPEVRAVSEHEIAALFPGLVAVGAHVHGAAAAGAGRAARITPRSYAVLARIPVLRTHHFAVLSAPAPAAGERWVGRLDDLYGGLPVPLQHAAVSSFGARWYWLRFGPGYRDAVDGFAGRDGFDADQWRAWQARALRPLLAAAAQRVPHYRDAWDRAARAGAARGDLAAVPLLDKGPLRADPERFVDPYRVPGPGRRLVFPTSGSSGTPVRTIWTSRELRASMAVREVRSAGWSGVSFRDPRATFSGRIVVPDPDSAGPFHRWNAVERQAYFSTFHLRAENAASYADAFRRHGLQWGTGYAQSFARLGRYLLDQGIDRPRLRSVIATSEKLSEGDRRSIEDAFSCVVREEYSSIENAVMATECERGSLHVSPDVGVVEILRPDGTPSGPGEVGEVVATGFLRRLQPLIRYRIGDLAAWSDEPCACGRAMPVLSEVVGRVEDVLVGPDGRRVTRFHGVFYEIPGLLEAQVVQRTPTGFTVRVVVTEHFADAGAATIVARMVDRLGTAAQVTVEPVPEIARTPAGKFRAVVSELP